jgi:hypothetical protein
VRRKEISGRERELPRIDPRATPTRGHLKRPSPKNPPLSLTRCQPTFAMQRPRKSFDGLPAELVDEVLSYVHSPDLVSLRCCSLICRSWRVRSQLILFKHVSLWNESRLQSWCATIPPSPNGISSFVRTLEVGGRWIRPRVLEHHIIHFTSLRRVRTLAVHDVDLKQFNEITFPRYFGQLGSSVQSLRLESCRSSIDTYLELLKHFTQLEDLFVSDASSTKDSGVIVELHGISGVNGSVQAQVDLDNATMPLWLSRIPWKVREARVAATTKSGVPFALDTLFSSPAHNLQRLDIELTKPRALHRIMLYAPLLTLYSSRAHHRIATRKIHSHGMQRSSADPLPNGRDQTALRLHPPHLIHRRLRRPHQSRSRHRL